MVFPDKNAASVLLNIKPLGVPFVPGEGGISFRSTNPKEKKSKDMVLFGPQVTS